jgi:4-hydroxybenzoate polyprenyltransferase
VNATARLAWQRATAPTGGAPPSRARVQIVRFGGIDALVCSSARSSDMHVPSRAEQDARPSSGAALRATGDASEDANRPLCVDLDGTLVRTDTLLECVLRVVKATPLAAFRLPLWLLRGRAHLKREVAARAAIDVTALPFHAELVEYLRAERARGRRLVLVTAADERIAHGVAEHLALFDEVLASDGTVNLKGAHKQALLRDRFGARGYDYAGNAGSDLAVWNEAHSAVMVNAGSRVRRRCTAEVTRAFDRERVGVRTLVKALRLQHWVKNLLIFVPLAMSHQIQNAPLLAKALLAFLAFGLCASGIYLVNDLFDLEADRRHPSKRSRPLASGALGLAQGLALAPLCLLAGFAVAILLPPAFFLTLALYLLLTLSYSLRLKQIAVLDVVVLAGLYTIRIIAGSAATGVVPSPWLLAFSLFFFFSLAMVKRFSELDGLRQRNGDKVTRGYYASDREQIASFGSASGYMAVLVLALYINSDAVVILYRQPIVLWLICPLLLYWISRVWLLAHRGEMHDDPVVFAIRDRVSYVVGACVALVLFVASTGVVVDRVLPAHHAAAPTVVGARSFP